MDKENNKLVEVVFYKDGRLFCDGIEHKNLNSLLNAVEKEYSTFFGKVASGKPSGKSTHRYRKEIANICFYVDYQGAKAKVFWEKRNVLRIIKGARLATEMPLNKNGDVGFSARFALTLREEHRDQIEDNLTKEDILLKSVNEVGHFLYFAGVNSWQVLKDENGKTIDEWAI